MTEAAVIALLTIWPDTDLTDVAKAAPQGHFQVRAAVLAAFRGAPPVAGVDLTLVDLNAAALRILGAIGLVDLERQTAPRTVTARSLIEYGRALQAFETAIVARQLAVSRNREAKAGDWQSKARAAIASYSADRKTITFDQALKAAEPIAMSANVSIETLKRRLREWPETADLPGKGRR